MLKIENVEVVGWEHAIRGMRNPKNSWEKSDTYFDKVNEEPCGTYRHLDNIYGNTTDWMTLGPNDHKLMASLAAGGPVHAKYRRMITVYLDITAPLYWWKEFDTYKVGTVANSCSTMHMIHVEEFTMEDFSFEHLMTCEDQDLSMNSPVKVIYDYKSGIADIIDALNNARSWYLATQDKRYWWQMIQLLPTSYNQKRTIMLNYEVLHNIYESRRHHKLDEWHVVCDWIESLPYSELITGNHEPENP